jgi:hypothetical protein
MGKGGEFRHFFKSLLFCNQSAGVRTTLVIVNTSEALVGSSDHPHEEVSLDSGRYTPHCGQKEIRRATKSPRSPRTGSGEFSTVLTAESFRQRAAIICATWRVLGQLRAFLYTFIRALPVNLFVLKAFSLTKVARMNNPLQGTRS